MAQGEIYRKAKIICYTHSIGKTPDVKKPARGGHGENKSLREGRLG